MLRVFPYSPVQIKSKVRLPLLIVYFILSTIYMITLAAFTQMTFVDDRRFPGGPSAYKDAMYYVPINEVNSNYRIRRSS